MSRRISSASGKAFLWLIVIAMACLVEGALLQSSSWAEATLPAVPTKTAVEQASAPGPDRGIYRALRIVSSVVRVIR